MNYGDRRLDFIIPEACEKDILKKLPDAIKEISEMNEEERVFLTGLILKYKPRKVLEIGVAAGASSAVILNALEHVDNAEFYSVDYSEKYYRDNSKQTGFFALGIKNNFKTPWRLHTGGVTAEFIEKIGLDIDFCLIDTMHVQPGEILDFLMVLPYLKSGAVIVLHDIALHLSMIEQQWSDCNVQLISVLKGQKLLPAEFDSEFTPFPNIGAVVLDKDIKDNLFDIFNLLLVYWKYSLSEHDYRVIYDYFKKHYDEYFLEIFSKTAEINKKRLARIKEDKNNYFTKLLFKILKFKLSHGEKRSFNLNELKNYKRRILIGE